MLVGLAASSYAVRWLTPPTPDSRPEATEPHRPPATVVNV
jgi:hypothetical protein